MRKILSVLLAIVLMLMMGSASAQQNPRRIALVIGNADYVVPAWKLANPVNDAELMTARLKTIGFSVETLRNASRLQMDQAFQRFNSRLKGAGKDAVGFFYYSGHGAEEAGLNYLVPADGNIRTKEELRYEAPSVQLVLDDMARAGNQLNFVILDACRDLPLPDSAKSLNRGGLAALPEVANVLIAYATAPGQTADDGAGRNSPFTTALAEALRTRAADPVALLFEDVQAAVRTTTKGTQRPRFSNGLGVPRWSFVTTAPIVRGSPPPPIDPGSRRKTLEPAEVQAEPVPPAPANRALAAINAISKAEWAAGQNAALVTRVIAASSRAELEKLAAMGDARAQFLAGRAYDFGSDGFPKDEAEAVRLYTLAAAQGNALGQASLGVMYRQGLGGLTKDEAEAVRLYKLAAAQGHAGGQVGLGFMYDRGLGGLTKDEAEAVRLYKLAAAQGNAQGQANLGSMYQQGLGGLTKDEAEAVRLYKLAAAQGNAYGQVSLGFMYDRGLGGLTKDEAEAVRLYKLAAAQGHALGQANLGVMYQQGLGGLPKNEAEAVRLYRLAAAQGDANGQAYLGVMYEYNLGGLTKDEVEAVRLYKLAAAQGDEFAKAQLKRLGK